MGVLTGIGYLSRAEAQGEEEWGGRDGVTTNGTRDTNGGWQGNGEQWNGIYTARDWMAAEGEVAERDGIVDGGQECWCDHELHECGIGRGVGGFEVGLRKGMGVGDGGWGCVVFF